MRLRMDAQLEKRVPLANLPTPIQYYPRISETYGAHISVKRDDLSESVASGNKLRKMEYVLYEATKAGADTLITCGGIQSNHCRTVAWIAAKMGLRCILLLRGDRPETRQGNYLIDSILGAEARFYSAEEFTDINAIAEDLCKKLRDEGSNPYYSPMGASVATGSLGYVRMVKELVESGQQFDKIYCALGSGGTYAGIVLGCQHFAYGPSIHGIAVCDDTAYFVNELTRIQKEFKEQYAINLDLEHIEQFIDDHYVGIGYAQNTKEELEILHHLAKTEGLVLDPVYSLKAFIGMLDHIKKGSIKPDERILFVHTGGHYGIFPKGNEFQFITL